MSTSTWNPERRFPWLGDTVPCPSPEEEAAERVAVEDRAATVSLYGSVRRNYHDRG